MTDPKTLLVDRLTLSLRAWCEAQQVGPEVLSAALAYELTRIIAQHAKTIEDAHHLLGHTFHTMRQQFRELGVGPQAVDPYP